MFPHPWLLLFCVMGVLLLLGATSGLVNSRLYMSEPLVCAIAGVLVGPLALNLIHLYPAEDPAARALLREAARVTLAIAVLAGAIRLPRGWLRRNWRGLAVVLGPGMILMAASGAAIAMASFQLPFLTCLLIGAMVAPTDPVLSAPVVTGALANRAVPTQLRHGITAESGINDGLAAPLVMLPIFLILDARPGDIGHALKDWGIEAVALEMLGAVAVGAAGGYLAKVCLRWAAEQEHADHASLLTIALALALATLGGLQALGENGVLGAFVAGAVLNEAYSDEYEQHQEHFNEAIGRFFDLPIMFLLGAAAPWEAWYALGWHGVAFVIALLLLRRIPAWLLLRRWIPWSRPLPHAIFAGWFGPIGAAALFYVCEAQDMTGDATLWPVVSLAAAASVVVHGITGTPVSRMVGDVLHRHTE